jgi:hypothetical protein
LSINRGPIFRELQARVSHPLPEPTQPMESGLKKKSNICPHSRFFLAEKKD